MLRRLLIAPCAIAALAVGLLAADPAGAARCTHAIYCIPRAPAHHHAKHKVVHKRTTTHRAKKRPTHHAGAKHRASHKRK